MFRTEPIRTFNVAPMAGQVYECLAELEQKISEHFFAMFVKADTVK